MLYSLPYIEMVVQGLFRFAFHRMIWDCLVHFPIQMKLDVKDDVFIRISTYKAGRGPCLYLINMT